ncbi:hypothetical protein [Amycolatopsis thermoflava]|uniref:hypothetical protein n=1 Tax=Amycolatopsis thermoflava TaxID=84480 RepID=UPI003EB88417
MTPGTDADVRRRRRTRNRFLGACLVVAAVTGTVVTGAFTDGLSGGVAGAVPAIALFLCAAAVLLAAQALHWHRFAVTRVRELAVAAATERPAVAGRDRQSRDARELLEHGTRVSATVVTAPDPRKGNATIEVTYPAGDTRRAAVIKLSTRQR